MKNPGRRPRRYGQNRLSRLLRTEFGGDQQLHDLFDEFLTQETYHRDFCLRLLAVARQGRALAWAIRRLVILMLEHQILKLDPDNLDEFDFLLTQLNLKQGLGPSHAISREVLKEGYSSTDLRLFVSELRRKLQRLNHVHEKIKGRKTSDAALRYFLKGSRDDCRLSLARYLFTPDGVADEILGRLQVTSGMPDIDTQRPKFIDEEVNHGLSRLPAFEARILERLCENSNTYWVSETTSSEINSLVEYPLTAVVAVIKPPGSDIEFEIKRVGRKGQNSLSVVYARDGTTVPPTHRLDGGSMQWLLRFEANAAARLSFIYRHAHGIDAPIANYVSRSNIFSVPVEQNGLQTLPYFTEPHLFGKDFRKMRVAMEESVRAFIEEGFLHLPALQGDLGLTAHFISQVAPAQAILSGTSSFRLDKVAAYLSTDGPSQYFEQGLGIPCSSSDGKRLADAVLREILGSYRPPNVRYRTHEQYVSAAFQLTENRATADRIYLSLVKQIARFWGTLLAARGYSRGESFIARNVGLKSFWDAGEWSVKIIFMDHDALVIPGRETRNFLAYNALPEMQLDERYIWGGATDAVFATSEVGYLRGIYRIGNELFKEGQVSALGVLKEAYKKTQQALLTNPKLRKLFHPRFINRLTDWDTFVTGYLQMNGDRPAASAWKKKIKRLLVAKGYRLEESESFPFAAVIEKHRGFVEKYRQIFETEERRQ